MKITILMGSPNKNGSISMLVSEFIRGAEEAGHSCEIIDVCHADIRPFEALVSHYRTLVRYIRFRDQGMVLGYGCGSPGMTGRSRYMREAYELGRSL